MVTDKDISRLIDILQVLCTGVDYTLIGPNASIDKEKATKHIKEFAEYAAEQARKEAAGKAVAFVKMLSSESRDLWGVWEDEHLQLAIMGGCDVCPTRPKCYGTESTPLQDTKDDPCNGVKMHLGYFENIEDAKNAYNEASKKYHGEYGRTS